MTVPAPRKTNSHFGRPEYIVEPLNPLEKRALLEREIEAEIAGEMELWQRKFAQWYAMQEGNVRMTRQAEVASILAGTTISPRELRLLRLRPAFQRQVTAIRAISDEKVNRAREIIADLLPKAAQIHGEMLDEVREKKMTGNAAALTVPLLDRAWPRKEESDGKGATQVVISISAERARAFVGEVSGEVVEAVEVKPDGTDG